MSGDSQLSLSLVSLLLVGGLLVVFLITFGVTYSGYRRYKKPLLEVDASVQYSFTHYLQLVVFPRLAYRIHDKFPGKSR